MIRFRLCVFGDSFSNGTGDDTMLGWAGRVCATARQRGHDVTLYNLGIRRDTSTDIAGRWQEEAARRLPAEQDGRLLFAFGANDCVIEDGAPRVPLPRSLENAAAILKGTARPTLMLGPIPAGDSLADSGVETLAQALAPLCAGLGIPFLPLHPVVRDCPDWAAEVRSGDGAHPNQGGYAALAAAVEAWPAWRAWVP
ncbi:Lipase/Acylhydrolase with GDSL-like motif [Roseomonas mucosa]|jgi:acyl-CoA thioesterase I|uniref:GDSL-like Lipase/Acylhydrolase n=1 Tax=Roseomonas mucosa TaxID=207340 RepID=A0A379N6K3_9PROT|nr:MULTISPECIES: GDSL-type esterase/lipase family protein [Roseomonas]MBS5901631.1 GDSL family lipase [Acetobacteraceae bacterium]MDT8263052.1 GDSL-type esterase/lipase family protein [Roseomonas sp. DSM 102946]ATR19982.1 GDSL family lipase [Roseomonas sp. FDAARGOS_362]AWV23575.1 Lipase/Acylhydrolase with GDSL-like motif [Roseomonas mucosa]MCG7353104.1 GDSL-type esterase/lipase family protein [Roseomonas mucosa]